MTLASWPQAFAGDREEDEVLVEWLRDNHTRISPEEKRDAVRRLCHEFGYTARGLSGATGIPERTVYKLRCSDEVLDRSREQARVRKRKYRQVCSARIVRLADTWQERAAQGLSPAEALELLHQLRDLASKRSSAA